MMYRSSPQPLILFGPLPPPHNGHTMAFQMLVDGCRERNVPHLVTSYSARWFPDTGRLRHLRPFEYAGVMAHYAWTLRQAPRGTVYITLNQATSGLIRDILLIQAAVLTRHRVFVHLHGGSYDQVLYGAGPLLRRIAIKTLQRCDGIILLSDRLRKMFKPWPQLDHLLRVVHNGLPFIPIDTPAAPKTRASDEPFRLLFLSHLIETKGWWEILEACEKLVHTHHLPIEARFCGNFTVYPGDSRFTTAAEAEKAFHAFVSRHGLEKHVTHTAFVEGAAKTKALQDAHVVLLPSRREGQPLCLIEGMAYGCALIGSAYGALPDLIEHDGNGYLVRPTSDAIAASLNSLAHDPDRLRRFSARSLERFREGFSRECHLDRLIPLLQADETRTGSIRKNT